MSEYMTAAEAMSRLGIKQQTLYAYVSRQLIRRVTPASSKRSLYAREDIERLFARNSRKMPPASAQAWQTDTPSGITTALTQITPQGPTYRGKSFTSLIDHPGRIENVAELLWTGVLLDEPLTWDHAVIPSNMEAALEALQLTAGQVPFLRVMATASIVMGEPAGKELRSGNTASLARRLVCAYAGCLGMLTAQPSFVRAQPGDSVAHVVLRALQLPLSEKYLAAVNAFLITCADHELSSPTYAARVVASTGAGLHACLLAGIVGHSGHHFGGSCDRTEDYFMARSTESADQETARVRSVGRLPGFDHPLYPEGDPRARYLMTLAETFMDEKPLRDIHAAIDEVQGGPGQKPALELGLVAMARALRLPRRGASALWAVGRSIGWVAHVIEQRLAGQVIRPRARYERW